MVEAPQCQTACPSCGHAFDGPYCSQCGEERLEPRKRTFWYFLTSTVVPEILDFDGKIWRTLRFLFVRPGFLALEYAAGRRRPYIGPFRVFLVAIIIWALSVGGTNFTLNLGGIPLGTVPGPIPVERPLEFIMSQIGHFGIVEQILTEKLGPVASVSEYDQLRFKRALEGIGTVLSLTVVAMFTFALYACFHRRRPLLVEHAVFSLHYFSFVLFLCWLGSMLFRLDIRVPIIVLILVLNMMLLYQIIYLTCAIRRCYFPLKGSKFLTWATSVGVAIPLYLLSLVFITGVQVLAGVIAAWSL